MIKVEGINFTCILLMLDILNSSIKWETKKLLEVWSAFDLPTLVEQTSKVAGESYNNMCCWLNKTFWIFSEKTHVI